MLFSDITSLPESRFLARLYKFSSPRQECLWQHLGTLEQRHLWTLNHNVDSCSLFRGCLVHRCGVESSVGL